ncbi:MAG: hypothetical protein NT013_00310 [Planctomycetia bacterium]|nr:hypothetical protein [Planctomycetia bacterium]
MSEPAPSDPASSIEVAHATTAPRSLRARLVSLRVTATLGGIVSISLLIGLVQFVTRPQPNGLPDAPPVTSDSQSVSESTAPDIRWDDGVANKLESLIDDLQRLDAETVAAEETSQISNLKPQIGNQP